MIEILVYLGVLLVMNLGLSGMCLFFIYDHVVDLRFNEQIERMYEKKYNKEHEKTIKLESVIQDILKANKQFAEEFKKIRSDKHE